ncbi:MAG: S8 family serine peptidase [Acidobacteria bacterium]|nr:S8 family serine peptidase [Acidobacteriota bacterium]
MFYSSFVRFFCLLALLGLTEGVWGQSEFRFTNGEKVRRYRLSADEVMVRPERAESAPAVAKRLAGLTAVESVRAVQGGAYVVKGTGQRLRILAGLQAPRGTVVAPIFYDLDELPAAERLAAMVGAARESRLRSAMRVVTPRLHVRLGSDAEWESMQPTAPVGRVASVVPGWTVVTYADEFAALAAIEWLAAKGNVEFAPVFSRFWSKKQALVRQVNDPLFRNQWHLATQGVNLSMGNTWDTYTGRGINIAVVDDGLDVAHEDFAGNTYPLDGNYHRNFRGGPPKDPTPQSADDSHGTSCAGLIAARGFNNLGVIGVAPLARLMGLRLIGEDAADDAAAEALLWQPEGIVTHISSNSWGPEDDGAAAGRMSEFQAQALEAGTTLGRNGRGIVYVISAGNGRGEDDNSSYDEFSSSRYAIQVCAVNKRGKQSSYSESGMALALCALGGEMAPPDQMWTTNNMGPEAQAHLKENAPTSTAPINYTDGFNGTSAAAPQVSGAAALLLERNPNLGYRDVKEILMRTARRDQLKDGDEFTANSAGFFFSHSFGTGLLDVNSAVEWAGVWKNLGPTEKIEATAEGPVEITEGGENGAVFEFDMKGGGALRVEHVEIVVDAEHPVRGEVNFEIVSPSGMSSMADRRPKDEGSNFEQYRFTSTRHWGERSDGVWKVTVADTEENGVSGVAKQVTLRIIGTRLPAAVSNADLSIESVTWRPSGNLWLLSAIVRNVGSAAAGAHRVGLYLSGNSTITTADTRFGEECSFTSLAVGRTALCARTLAIPATLRPGDYYVGALAHHTDQIAEINEINNSATAANRLTVGSTPAVDLIVSDGKAPTSASPGQSVSVSVEVTNQGTAAAGAFRVGFYISPRPTLTTADMRLGTCTFASLAGGAKGNCSAVVTIPANLPLGRYYAGAIADDLNQVTETDETNNEGVSEAPLTIGRQTLPDLIITDGSAPATGTTGQPVRLSVEVKNQGTASAGAFRVGYYLSVDSVITRSDTQIGTCNFSSLGIDVSATCSGNITLPLTLAPGTYYVGAFADDTGQVNESDEGNNTALAPNQMVVTRASVDLTVTAVTAPATVTLGQSPNITSAIRNQGTADAGAFRLGYYLSTDATITTGDIQLGTCSYTALAAGANSGCAGPLLFPATLAPGRYYLGVIVDDQNQVAESNETNNTRATPGLITLQR